MQNVLIAGLIAVAALIAVLRRKLTPMAGFIGCILALAIGFGSGVAGLLMLGLFFVSGTLATSVGSRTKRAIHADDNNGGRRTTGQVLANGGTAGVCGLLSWLFPQHAEVLIVMVASALSSATADTLSSELGTVYGKRFYNVLTFRKDRRGENGVVSVEGTFFGLAGSALIAVTCSVYYGWGTFLPVVIAGTAGNITDSILGATLERRGHINNNAVNLLNTVAAALVVLLFV